MGRKQRHGDPHGFDPAIVEIEREIVDFFYTTGATEATRNPILTSITAFLYTRQSLTQREARSLSGFSTGAVSQALNQLLSMGLVSKKRIPGTHEYVYTLGSFQDAMSSFITAYSRRVRRAERGFTEIRDELESRREELATQPRYGQMLDLVNQFARMFHVFSDLDVLVERELERVGKRDGNR
ncbi:MAG: hypothetical protein JW839_13815 [Candidatus Lokiarchaeota archaeon]|nr:hypothetical protein [Candidatus Lokiarchaeota archaeon]